MSLARLLLFCAPALVAAACCAARPAAPSGPPAAIGSRLAEPGATVRIAVVGDSGRLGCGGRRHAESVIAGMAAFDPDAVLHLGDLVYFEDGSPEEEIGEAFTSRFGDLRARVPLLPTAGNHDAARGPALHAHPPDGVRAGPLGAYAADLGPIHVTAIDTSGGPHVPAEVLAWLERDLQAARDRPWRVVFTHYPPLHEDREGRVTDRPDLGGLLATCRRGGVRLLLCGHEHGYRRYRPIAAPAGPLHLVVSGGGGAELARVEPADPRNIRSANVFHHLRLTATAASLVLVAVDEDDVEVDRLAIDR